MVDWHYVIPLKMLPAFGYILTREHTKVNVQWYLGVEQPPWALTKHILYVPAFAASCLSSGCACFLVWTQLGESEQRRLVMIPYLAQMICLWTDYPVLVGRQNLTGGLVDITLTTILASIAGFAFWRVNPHAGYAMLPYLGFLLYEVCCNVWMYRKWQENFEAWHEAEENP